MQMNHAQLQEDLARWFQWDRSSGARRPVVATELAIEGSYNSHGRMDLVLFRALQGYQRMVFEGYEVKATRADFLSDIRSGKWEQYLPRLTQFYFAVPSGLVQNDEVPGPAGLIVRTENVKDVRYTSGRALRKWRVVKRADPLSQRADHVPADAGVIARILYKVSEQRYTSGVMDERRGQARGYWR